MNDQGPIQKCLLISKVLVAYFIIIMKGITLQNFKTIESENNFTLIADQIDVLQKSAMEFQDLLNKLNLQQVKSQRGFLNTMQASEYLGFSINTIRKYTSKKLLTHYKVGKMCYFTTTDLDNFVINGKNKIKSTIDVYVETVTNSACKTTRTNPNRKNAKGGYYEK